MIVAAEHGVSLRPLGNNEADYRLLARWLTDERVLAFYEGRDNPFPYARVVEQYGPCALGEDEVAPYLILEAGTPVGYLQYYSVADDSLAEYDLPADLPDRLYGIDLFIGEPDRWGRGIGAAALRATVRHIFDVHRADAVIIDPHVDNVRAIRSYEKAGFRRVKLLPRHELHEGVLVDCWLMRADNR